VTRPLPEPFTLMLDLQSGRLDPHTTRIERRASDLRGAFADAAALEGLIAGGDPVLYHVLQYDVPEQAGQLICCTTILQPGTVGDEYFMTRGHYHAVRETAELYLGLSGTGYLLLATEDGQSDARPLTPGTVAYVPPCWAHRTVNTGTEPLVFLAVYPAQAGHDYAAAGQGGFGQRVRSSAAGPVLS
jgi:glucose-6-phosphate isomerase, archaeal